jgi:hypothetical protein
MPHYPEIIYWLQNYAQPGVADKRAVETFMDCETREKVQSLKAQLYAVANGKYEDGLMQKLLGGDRKARHGSYLEWSKIMLQWMAGYKSS